MWNFLLGVGKRNHGAYVGTNLSAAMGLASQRFDTHFERYSWSGWNHVGSGPDSSNQAQIDHSLLLELAYSLSRFSPDGHATLYPFGGFQVFYQKSFELSGAFSYGTFNLLTGLEVQQSPRMHYKLYLASQQLFNRWNISGPSVRCIATVDAQFVLMRR